MRKSKPYRPAKPVERPRKVKFPQFGVEVRISKIHGMGVFATKYFNPGAFIGAISGVVPEVPDPDCKYSIWFEDSRGRSTTHVPHPPFRYLNHASECNAEMDRTTLYALDHILAGDEITIYYGEEWDEEENKENMTSKGMDDGSDEDTNSLRSAEAKLKKLLKLIERIKKQKKSATSKKS
ncbi:MAG: SET domain-containing protein [Candidatus Paceibacterota bacterium]